MTSRCTFIARTSSPFVGRWCRGHESSYSPSITPCITCEGWPFVLPWPLIKVRIPVMVPPGIWGSSLKGPVDLLVFPEVEWAALDLDRHKRWLRVERRSFLLFVYHVLFDPGDTGRLSWALDTKNVRNAVAAVIVNAKFAAMNCQYVSQTVSIDLKVRPVWIPAIRVMVQMMVRIVRQREDDNTTFWDHLILTFQISRQGIYKTWVRV